MRFGSSAAEDTKATADSGDRSTRWIKGWKNGETTVKFLDERDKWTVYYEHWNMAKQRYFPCTRDRENCPGCTSEAERERAASKRYLTNALVGRYVDVYKIPASIIDSIDRYYTKDKGTILKRPYTIIRSGSGGTETSYDVDYEDREVWDPDDYRDQMADHEEMLQAAYTEVWGELPDEQPEERPRRSRRREPEPEEAPAKPAKDDDPPSEPQPETADAAEEDEEILSEDEIRAMSIEDLLDLYKRVGIVAPAVADSEAGRKRLADKLIEELGE